ncbi:Uncharacterized protein APZ42_007739 [Daphnia magna]|uniref:Uncharacterized protein n=1 Tax=Daphnia magna TaxID=35525 RepID=A0A162BTX5_9CRUS|nr:Uncharacterized protein APZ42_007739 [Daphnia magna]
MLQKLYGIRRELSHRSLVLTAMMSNATQGHWCRRESACTPFQINCPSKQSTKKSSSTWPCSSCI